LADNPDADLPSSAAKRVTRQSTSATSVQNGHIQPIPVAVQTPPLGLVAPALPTEANAPVLIEDTPTLLPDNTTPTTPVAATRRSAAAKNRGKVTSEQKVQRAIAEIMKNLVAANSALNQASKSSPLTFNATDGTEPFHGADKSTSSD